MNKTTTPPKALDSKISLQRFAMAAERVWAVAHWPLMILGVAFILLVSGALLNLSAQPRMAVLLSLLILFLASLIPLVKLALPSRYAAMRRMEQEAGLSHRSVSASSEDLVDEMKDPETAAIWTEHKRRVLAGLDHVPVSKPRSSWRSFDPTALRVPMAAAAVAAWFLGSGDLTSSLRNTLTFAPPAAAMATTAVDAWLKPPAYTKKPPVLLTSEAMRQKLAADGEMLVPEKSILTLRATGFANPSLEVMAPGVEGKVLSDVKAKTSSSDTGFAAEIEVTRPVTVVLKDGGATQQSWTFAVTPDRAPEIRIPKPSEVEGLGSLTVFWEVKDDYGVKEVTSEMSLADEQANGTGFEDNGIFLYDPPAFKVKLKKSNALEEKGKTTQDLTAHPWAGFVVDLELTATDAAGHATKAVPLKITLPERPFSRPLAQAIVEQRKALILAPDNADDVAEMIDFIGAYPRGLTDRTGHLIRLGMIESSIRNAQNYDDLKVTVDEMWQLAVEIEDGSLKDARAELKALKEQLEQAIREGASKEKIAELSQKLRDAMEKYMKQLQAERDKNPQKNQQQSQNSEQRSITQEDLQKMMDAIEELSKSGAKEQAQALLDELDRILQNLEMGEGQQAGDPADQQLQDMMDQLGEMMKRQQELMDETQKMPGPGGQPGEQMQGDPNQQGENGQGEGKDRGGMAQRQGDLGEMLDKLMQELGRDAPGQLGKGRQSMEGAEGNLRGGNRPGALQDQGDAMQALREGAGELGKMMRERQANRGQGQTGNRGRRDGEGNARNDDDPLGRPRATRNPDEGPDKDMVPGDIAIRRAREILEQLRSRANEGTLSDTERGYIDRLLRGLY